MKLTPDRGGPRVNEGIDIPNIQLIDAGGTNLGVVATEAAPGLRLVGGPPFAPSVQLGQSAFRAALELQHRDRGIEGRGGGR